MQSTVFNGRSNMATTARRSAAREFREPGLCGNYVRNEIENLASRLLKLGQEYMDPPNGGENCIKAAVYVLRQALRFTKDLWLQAQIKRALGNCFLQLGGRRKLKKAQELLRFAREAEYYLDRGGANW